MSVPATDDHSFVHTYYPDVLVDPMDDIIAAAVSKWNAAIIDRTTTQKATIMSDHKSSYILTNDVPAFLAEHTVDTDA